MKIVAVDDERIALNGVMNILKKLCPLDQIEGYSNGLDLFEDNVNYPCDVALLDIEMREINGIDLAKKLKLMNPKTNIIFTTGYSEYTYDAFQMHSSGYILKPITEEKVKRELDNLRYPQEGYNNEKMKIKTFGNFEIFMNGMPITFARSKTKELFAYLVDRNGALCTNGELIGILWGNSPAPISASSYLRQLFADLRSTLKLHNCEDIIVKKRNQIGIIVEKVDCDLYDWIKGKPYAINNYRGEYMMQYSWSVFSYKYFEENENV